MFYLCTVRYDVHIQFSLCRFYKLASSQSQDYVPALDENWINFFLFFFLVAAAKFTVRATSEICEPWNVFPLRRPPFVPSCLGMLLSVHCDSFQNAIDSVPKVLFGKYNAKSHYYVQIARTTYNTDWVGSGKMVEALNRGWIEPFVLWPCVLSTAIYRYF